MSGLRDEDQKDCRRNMGNLFLSDMPAQKVRVIGLTGVMGTGKSSVIWILQEKGITALDCDVMNAQLLQKYEEGYTALIQMFGTGTLNDEGNITHQRMSDLIFYDPEKKKQAEGTLHPLIKKCIFEELALHAKESVVAVEVPLLFEVHWEDAFDEVWVVACDEELLLSRLKLYRHIFKEEALRCLRLQLPQQEKIKRADVVFYNNSDSANLRRQTCDILNMKRQLR